MVGASTHRVSTLLAVPFHSCDHRYALNADKGEACRCACMLKFHFDTLILCVYECELQQLDQSGRIQYRRTGLRPPWSALSVYCMPHNGALSKHVGKGATGILQKALDNDIGSKVDHLESPILPLSHAVTPSQFVYPLPYHYPREQPQTATASQSVDVT